MFAAKISKSEKELFKLIRDRLINHFGPEQIMSILAYGNRINNRQLVDVHSDYDVTIVFRDYPSKNLPDLPSVANITMLFWPDIKLCGVRNFRLYNHGEFYIFVLSAAKTLYGTNPFKKLKKELPKYNIINSLKEQILLHCSKLAAIIIQQKSFTKQRNIIKYSFRIAQNFYFLKSKKINYRIFTNKSYIGWIKVFRKNKTFSEDVLQYLENLIDNDKDITISKVFNYIHLIKSALLKMYESKVRGTRS